MIQDPIYINEAQTYPTASTFAKSYHKYAFSKYKNINKNKNWIEKLEW